MIGWLFEESFQKSGAESCCSIFSSSDFLAAESKIPPDAPDAGTEIVEVAIEFV
jgi:hypothetical protein